MGLQSLAAINWLDHRILATDDKNTPFVVKNSMINLQSKELDDLASKVEQLAATTKTPEMAVIAAKCWDYIRVRAEQIPIHISFRAYNPPMAQCNKVFKECYPASHTRVAVECAGGSVLISEAEEAILKRESVPFREKTLDLSKMGISARSFELLLAHLCGGKIDHREIDFTTLLDLMQAASLMRIKHLATEYIYTIDYSTREMEFQTIRAEVLAKIQDLKCRDSNCFKNEVLLNSYQRVIHDVLRAKCNYDYMNCCTQEMPIRHFKFGRQFNEHGNVGFGPELPDLRAWSRLEHVEIDGWRVTKEGVEQLLTLQHLESIKFHACNFTPEALEALPQLEKLKSIKIHWPLKQGHDDWDFINERLFVTLGQCKNLTHISLCRGGGVKDEWLEHLSGLNLQSFKLNRVSDFTGTGLAFLNAEKLQELKLEICWELTENGVKHIQRFPSLESLDVCIDSGEKDTHQGIDQALITMLPHLRLRKFALSNQHETSVPEKLVYASLPPMLEEFDHFALKPSTPIGISDIERGSRLNRWRTHSFHPSPLDIELALSQKTTVDRLAATIRDHVTDLVDYVRKLVI